MVNHILFESKKLYFKEKGKGKTIVLLHGYLESMNIWDDFQAELAQHYHTIAIDIIGHGLSDEPREASVEYIAEQVRAVMDHLAVGSCSLIGHSMGGYAALAFAEKYEQRMEHLILLNSHPFAESDSRKQGRLRETELVKSGKKNLLVNVSISRSFTKENIGQLKDTLNKCVKIAQETSDEAVLCAIQAIVNKPDRCHVLRNMKRPVLILHGKQDINLDQFCADNLSLPLKARFIELDNCAHMGMFEQKDACIQHIMDFIGAPSSN